MAPVAANQSQPQEVRKALLLLRAALPTEWRRPGASAASRPAGPGSKSSGGGPGSGGIAAVASDGGAGRGGGPGSGGSGQWSEWEEQLRAGREQRAAATPTLGGFAAGKLPPHGALVTPELLLHGAGALYGDAR
ncbi:hypothetical protein T484DRAFT_1880921, partial [Baffinella frigidus]